MLHGCTVGDRSLIGIQAIILNKAHIGAESLVGAGALVTEGKVFPPRSPHHRCIREGRARVDGRGSRQSAYQRRGLRPACWTLQEISRQSWLR